MARVWIARHLPHASGHGHPMGSQKKKVQKKGRKIVENRGTGSVGWIAVHHCFHR